MLARVKAKQAAVAAKKLELGADKEDLGPISATEDRLLYKLDNRCRVGEDKLDLNAIFTDSIVVEDPSPSPCNGLRNILKESSSPSPCIGFRNASRGFWPSERPSETRGSLSIGSIKSSRIASIKSSRNQPTATEKASVNQPVRRHLQSKKEPVKKRRRGCCLSDGDSSDDAILGTIGKRKQPLAPAKATPSTSAKKISTIDSIGLRERAVGSVTSTQKSVTSSQQSATSSQERADLDVPAYLQNTPTPQRLLERTPFAPLEVDEILSPKEMLSLSVASLSCEQDKSSSSKDPSRRRTSVQRKIASPQRNVAPKSAKSVSSTKFRSSRKVSSSSESLPSTGHSSTSKSASTSNSSVTSKFAGKPPSKQTRKKTNPRLAAFLEKHRPFIEKHMCGKITNRASFIQKHMPTKSTPLVSRLELRHLYATSRPERPIKGWMKEMCQYNRTEDYRKKGIRTKEIPWEKWIVMKKSNEADDNLEIDKILKNVTDLKADIYWSDSLNRFIHPNPFSAMYAKDDIARCVDRLRRCDIFTKLRMNEYNGYADQVCSSGVFMEHQTQHYPNRRPSRQIWTLTYQNRPPIIVENRRIIRGSHITTNQIVLPAHAAIKSKRDRNDGCERMLVSVTRRPEVIIRRPEVSEIKLVHSRTRFTSLIKQRKSSRRRRIQEALAQKDNDFLGRVDLCPKFESSYYFDYMQRIESFSHDLLNHKSATKKYDSDNQVGVDSVHQNAMVQYGRVDQQAMDPSYQNALIPYDIVNQSPYGYPVTQNPDAYVPNADGYLPNPICYFPSNKCQLAQDVDQDYYKRGQALAAKIAKTKKKREMFRWKIYGLRTQINDVRALSAYALDPFMEKKERKKTKRILRLNPKSARIRANKFTTPPKTLESFFVDAMLKQPNPERLKVFQKPRPERPRLKPVRKAKLAKQINSASVKTTKQANAENPKTKKNGTSKKGCATQPLKRKFKWCWGPRYSGSKKSSKNKKIRKQQRKFRNAAEQAAEAQHEEGQQQIWRELIQPSLPLDLHKRKTLKEMLGLRPLWSTENETSFPTSATQKAFLLGKTAGDRHIPWVFRASTKRNMKGSDKRSKTQEKKNTLQTLEADGKTLEEQHQSLCKKIANKVIEMPSFLDKFPPRTITTWLQKNEVKDISHGVDWFVYDTNCWDPKTDPGKPVLSEATAKKREANLFHQVGGDIGMLDKNLAIKRRKEQDDHVDEVEENIPQCRYFTLEQANLETEENSLKCFRKARREIHDRVDQLELVTLARLIRKRDFIREFLDPSLKMKRKKEQKAFVKMERAASRLRKEEWHVREELQRRAKAKRREALRLQWEEWKEETEKRKEEERRSREVIENTIQTNAQFEIDQIPQDGEKMAHWEKERHQQEQEWLKWQKGNAGGTGRKRKNLKKGRHATYFAYKTKPTFYDSRKDTLKKSNVTGYGPSKDGCTLYDYIKTATKKPKPKGKSGPNAKPEPEPKRKRGGGTTTTEKPASSEGKSGSKGNKESRPSRSSKAWPDPDASKYFPSFATSIGCSEVASKAPQVSQTLSASANATPLPAFSSNTVSGTDGNWHSTLLHDALNNTKKKPASLLSNAMQFQ